MTTKNFCESVFVLDCCSCRTAKILPRTYPRFCLNERQAVITLRNFQSLIIDDDMHKVFRDNAL